MKISKLKRAIQLAKFAHEGQKRKYTGEKYVAHPLRVAKRIQQAGWNDKDTLIAAVLHDTVEDTFVTLHMIEELFGERVAFYVKFASSASKLDGFKATRKERKEYDLSVYLNGPLASKMIKVADATDNCKSIIIEDPKFAKTYMPEKIRMVEDLKQSVFKPLDGSELSPVHLAFSELLRGWQKEIMTIWDEVKKGM